MLCYRCGGHVKDGSERCASCGQRFDAALGPAAFGNGYRRPRHTIEGAPCQPGDLVAGRYLVSEHIGAGPLGWTYRAVEASTENSVALKILSPRFLQMPEEKRTFLVELHKAQRLAHPNIARIYQAGEDAGRPFIVAQHLDGLTLRRIMDLRRQKGQRFTLQEVEPIVAQIAAALDAASAAFAHGNLKPDNVVVLPDLLKLTDFGLGVSLPRAPFMAAQKAGGVHRYLAPEFLLGEPLDPRTDVFSLGVMLGEMLSSEIYEPQLNLLEKNPGLPAPVEAVFRRAVAPRASARYASAGEMAAELSELIAATPRPIKAPAEDAGDVVIEEAQTDPRLRIARALKAERTRKTAPGEMPPLPFTPPPPYQPPEPVSSPRALAPAAPAQIAAPAELLSADTAIRASEPAAPLAVDPSKKRRGLGKRSKGFRARRPAQPSESEPAWASPPATEGALAIGPTTPALAPIAPERPRAQPPARPQRPPGAFVALEEEPRSRAPLYAVCAIAAALIAGGAWATLARSSPAATAAAAPPEPARPAAAAEPAEPAPAPEKKSAAAPPKAEPPPKSHSLREKIRSLREQATKALAERKRKRDEALAQAESRRAAAEKEKKAAVVTSIPAGAIRGLEDSDVLVDKERAAASDFQCPPGMVKVPGGAAVIGSDPGDDLRNFGDRPAASVNVPPYCMDLFEFPNQPGKLPKVAAAYAEAESLCKNAGKRLCSEEEWEKACKGPQQLRFPYGQDFDADACNTQDRSGGPRQTTIVGAFSRCKSGYGIWDLSGNAAEWTMSAFDSLGPEKVVKGGHAARPSFDDRCASRRKLATTVHDIKVGFRCCTDAR